MAKSLDPGCCDRYRSLLAVIALIGGRLSHGAMLLRELRMPSAVVPEVDLAWLGRRVVYDNGEIRLAT